MIPATSTLFIPCGLPIATWQVAGGSLAYSGPGQSGSRGTLINGQDTAVWFADYEVPVLPNTWVVVRSRELS